MVIFAVCLTLLLRPAVASQESPQPPRAENGILDLRTWDFSARGSIPLSGQWEFWWGQHLSPLTTSTPEPPAIVQVPETWNTYTWKGNKLPGQGIATYRLRVLMPRTDKQPAFKFLDLSTACRLYVNGMRIYHAGAAGKTPGTTTPEYKPEVVAIPSGASELDITIHISNFHHWQGGLWERILLGNKEDHTDYREKRLYLEALMFGSILIMAVYHLCLHGFRPQDRSSLWFGLFCLMMAVRTITHGERFICLLMPDLSWDTLVRWIYVTFHLCIPFFAWYANAIFPKDISLWMPHLLTLLGGSCDLISLLAPTKVLTLTMPFMQVVILVTILYSAWITGQIVRRDRQDAGIFVAGFLIFSAAIINDILYTRQIIVTVHLASLGLLLFILFQAVLISRRFSRAFFTITRQQQDLEAEIIQRKKAEAAVVMAAEHEKYALVGQVAGKMAHDFNNLLGGIMGHAELSLLDCTQKDIGKSLEVIVHQAKQGQFLTSNLVAFAKDQVPREVRFNINEKVDMALALLKKDLESVEVTLDLSPDLPDLVADPGMIEQALVNLLLNAVHAVSRTPRPELSIATTTEGGRIRLEIRDNGCGIPEPHQKRIFEPAFTLKGKMDIFGAYSDTIKGTGYGMANVKRCLDKHGAEITFTSRPGKGTAFVLMFQGTAPGDPEAMEAEARQIPGISNKRILLVEDEEIISFVLEKILTSPPFSNILTTARDAETAMALIDTEHFDIISLDFLLPGGKTGLDVYHHIRRTNTKVPIVFVSGNLHFIESIQVMKDKDPFLDHLVKPFENMEYAAMIAKWLA
ncbi:MAG: ATP-binding protein [Desulfobacterales bacterium]|nr:ATP-binding protein [Desulfobacterales bacterium]